ncbi:MAG TPA: DoxX family protein [Polyangiaceae bacterium]|nr:DoxX family protein [Polyangiaceae bacterium]
MSTPTPPSTSLNFGLWSAHWLLGVLFVGTGVWKLVTPIAELAKAMPWMGQVSPAFFYFTAAADLSGGLGLLLPGLTRIKPGVTVLAAVGCVLLQLGAIVFHFSRGEAANTPFNFVLVLLSAFVAWGRLRAPIAAR